MSEDKVTYVELKLPKSKKQDKRNPAHKRREFPWHIIAGSLGVLCIFLLTTTVLFYFQGSCKCESMRCPEGNVTSSPDLTTSTVDQRLASTDKEIPSYTCFGKWPCYGKTCYYFSKEEKSWDESKLSCENRDSLLIKFNNKDEQICIQQRTQHYSSVYYAKKEINVPGCGRIEILYSRS
ncbi:NKG2-A/NKG2-B type II integral membrane protein-like [Talpa occidentalis]|uniref:NKG2-A/NKG2-B type II integral membrane protein-like n=1 Tax=Talpa occidentalis TaxID=50954 RepID=UPI00188E451E|nr:NKG2-A/NKG2-B type II integral membrane protein-like [Talpa occidentalis]XP_054552422.1 NKG2-A/NKG2-B type II integral membrane protein-like [Talpa occidentalis]XP_054552423.1 NKG2-A/NKG2-B type II integral membrane protein-like [Talpa occidentalis]